MCDSIRDELALMVAKRILESEYQHGTTEALTTLFRCNPFKVADALMAGQSFDEVLAETDTQAPRQEHSRT
jgi:hypothetical protein